MMRYLYMGVTADQYEFPQFVCDTVQELAEHYGTTENNVRSSISKAERKGSKSRFRRVEIDGSETDGLCSRCEYNPINQIIRNGGENICPDAFKPVAVYCKKNQKAEE